MGCDLCSNWFHGSCVGIRERQAKKIDSFVCDDCKKAKESTDEELYCICRKPYNDKEYDDLLIGFCNFHSIYYCTVLVLFLSCKRFYVGCDGCQDWFHATCVGISREEAEQLDSYMCPKCQKNKRTRHDLFLTRSTQRQHWDLLTQIWSNVKVRHFFLSSVDITTSFTAFRPHFLLFFY